MDRGVAVMAMAGAGGLIAMQAPINGRLGQATGSFQAAFVSFFIGSVALLVVAAFSKGGLGQIGNARHLGLIYLTGGLMGAIYVTAALTIVRTLGAGGVTAGTIAGQLTLAMVVDQFGLFGVARAPITAERLAGVALLAVGVFLIVRR